MTECMTCGELLDLATDDNYNVDHTKIGCPNCGDFRYAIEYERELIESTGDTDPIPKGGSE